MSLPTPRGTFTTLDVYIFVNGVLMNLSPSTTVTFIHLQDTFINKSEINFFFFLFCLLRILLVSPER